LVSDSVVVGNTVQDSEYYNIWLRAVHRSIIAGNTLLGGRYGITLLQSSSNNTIVKNIIEKPSIYGIEIKAGISSPADGDGAKNNVISENSIYYSGGDGIHIVNTPSDFPCANDYNIITNNTIEKSQWHGISLASNYNLIENNSVLESSQGENNKYDGIFLYDGASYNEILGNILRKGAGVNKPRYGINIYDARSVENVVRDNDLRDSGHTGNFNDAGTDTKL
jgi:parallel beta-helix repeat protein